MGACCVVGEDLRDPLSREGEGDTEASLAMHVTAMAQASVTRLGAVFNDLLLPGSLNPKQPYTLNL